MDTATRQQLTDCIVPSEFMRDDAKPFPLAWLFLSVCMNDTIALTPAFKEQLDAMFNHHATRETWKRLVAITGE